MQNFSEIFYTYEPVVFKFFNDLVLPGALKRDVNAIASDSEYGSELPIISTSSALS